MTQLCHYSVKEAIDISKRKGVPGFPQDFIYKFACRPDLAPGAEPFLGEVGPGRSMEYTFV